MGWRHNSNFWGWGVTQSKDRMMVMGPIVFSLSAHHCSRVRILCPVEQKKCPCHSIVFIHNLHAWGFFFGLKVPQIRFKTFVPEQPVCERFFLDLTNAFSSVNVIYRDKITSAHYIILNWPGEGSQVNSQFNYWSIKWLLLLPLHCPVLSGII